jgi:GAF domain/Sel1 repeat
MTSPVPAEGAGSSNYVCPDGNGFQDVSPSSPLSKRHNEVRTPNDGGALNALLAEIVSLPKVSGAAIAVDVGDCLECRASRGQSAPPIGTRCYPGAGLTGACLATSEIQICNNADEDSQVDRKACQQLGVRSVLVVPIKHGSQITGVLEALSAEPDAFDEDKLSCIKSVAERLGWLSPQPSSILDWNHHDRTHLKASSEQPVSHLPLVRTPRSKFDLQEVLEATYVIQQHQHVSVSQNHPAFGHRDIASGNDLTIAKCSNPADQLCAALSPVFYNFEQKFPGENRYRNLSIASILLAVLVGAYFLTTHYEKASRLVQTAKISGIAGEATGAPLAVGSAAQYPLTAQNAAGKVAPQTYAAAIASFEDAARKGDAEAGWKVGLSYLRGIGVVKDETRAAEWFKKAANLGDVRAQTALSDLYFNGVGVRRDYVRAYTWANIAARAGQAEDERLEELRQRMTTAQLEDANRRTAAWFARKSKP